MSGFLGESRLGDSRGIGRGEFFNESRSGALWGTGLGPRWNPRRGVQQLPVQQNGGGEFPGTFVGGSFPRVGRPSSGWQSSNDAQPNLPWLVPFPVPNPCCCFQQEPLPPTTGILRPPEYTGGRSANITGDPHFAEFDGGQFDFQGQAGNVYNLLSDQNFNLNGQFVAFGGQGATVVGEAGLRLGPDQIHLSANNPLPTINQQAMEVGRLYQLADGTALWDNGELVVTSNEYGLTITPRTHATANYLDLAVNLTDAGPYSDFVAPHGLLGVTVNHGQVDNGRTGANAQGEGVIERPEDFVVSNGLFGTQSASNRFGAQIARIITQPDGTIDTVLGQRNQVLFTAP
ncbi:MAG: hypothetical protein SFZ03_02885 [Candidatus Melainabacteria bacterium]|nr:hypothetical protein [Candidatus Melainabacteria bacterium]